MIIPDINLVVYAHDTASPWHEAAKLWWQSVLNGTESVGIPVVVPLGFVRLLSNPQVVKSPADPARLAAIASRWFDRPMVRSIGPGARHWEIYAGLYRATGAGSSMATDTHLASLALELGATLYSNDSDFTRFPGLSLANPLK